MTFDTTKITDRLDEILKGYLSVDQQIQDGLSSIEGFYESDKYNDLKSQKDELRIAYGKLTDALVAINTYM